MRITPLDIRKQEFRKSMRGLDGDEVYAFLTTVAEEYETVLSDNKRLRERIVEIEDRLAEFKSMETNLRNTLLTAERLTAEAKENAHREAGLIVREAEMEAERAAESIRAHTQQLRREILELKKHKDNYISRLRTLLESQQNIVSGFEDNFAEVDREIEKIGQKVEADSNAAVPGTRMSRDRITEDFTREPKGKVTWEDERRREDVPRPSMPRQGQEGTRTPDRKASPPREDAVAHNPATARAPEGYAVRRSGEPGYSQAARPVRGDMRSPAAGLASMAPAGEAAARAGYAGVAPEATETVEEADSLTAELFDDVENKNDVARKIEDSMYPKMNIPEAGPVESQRDMDDWKSYEVEKAKQDWSGYELDRDGAHGMPPAQPAAPSREGRAGAYPASGPSDSEVDQALSGLEEIADQGAHDRRPHVGEVPKRIDPLVRERAAQERVLKPGNIREARPEAGGQEPAAGSNTEWSMDDLRRNLTNMDRDDS